MAGKKKYYKLDDVGIVGSQKKKSSATKKYHIYKTSEVFRTLQEDEHPHSKKQLKKPD